jgi:GNAT superfamily N-acetyltransferase
MTAAIRAARPGEEGAIVPLYRWLFDPPGSVPPGWDPAAAEQRLARTLAGPGSVLLLAEEGGPVGLCSAYIDLDSVRYGLRCWVEDLAVDPTRRSRGIGGALLDAAAGWAREHGATHLELDSGRARADAHRFYERRSPSWEGIQYSWWLPSGSTGA